MLPEDQRRRDGEGGGVERGVGSGATPWRAEEREEGAKAWAIVVFALIGATATTYAERIRRMQSVFNRERNKYNRSYESWREQDASGYHQHFQRDDWYWKTDTTYKDQKDQRAKPGSNHSYTGNHTMSHHYSIMGLDRTRKKPYTDAEIKTAFRAKAMEYHPDQNQNNKEAAEAKFKEVMTSYEAIKLERKNASC